MYIIYYTYYYTNFRPGVLYLAAQMSQVSQVTQASQTYNKLNNFGKNGKLVRSHKHGKPNTYHSRLKSDSACGRAGRQIQQWPRLIVSCFRPFPVWRQPDTFTLKNFELLACYWHWHIEFPLFLATFPASPSKARTPSFSIEC